MPSADCPTPAQADCWRCVLASQPPRVSAQIVSGEACVWQWCRVPEGCATANGTVPVKTCMTSRQENFPIDWQNGTTVSGESARAWRQRIGLFGLAAGHGAALTVGAA